jgi:hypothetical protein
MDTTLGQEQDDRRGTVGIRYDVANKKNKKTNK